MPGRPCPRDDTNWSYFRNRLATARRSDSFGTAASAAAPRSLSMKFGSFVVALVVLAAGFAATGCGATPTSSSTVSAIVVTGLVPGVGGSSQFAASAALAGGTTQDVTSTATWSSSNSAVATVSASGLVTA